MGFVRYPHLERYGNEEVSGINIGTVHVFPKLDGTNASVWMEGGKLSFGSRNRLLDVHNDNAGFMNANTDSKNLHRFFLMYPNFRLFGEWLVPHTVKGYRDESWRKFYVFDVMDEKGNFVHYQDYVPSLVHMGIDFIPCIKIIQNGNLDQFKYEAMNCKFLLSDDNLIGEGVVLKNYEFTNKYGRTTWAKIVNQEFKEDFYVAMGAPVKENHTNEETITDLACTEVLVRKTYAKILNDVGEWNSRLIPRLLDTVYHEVVTEELWNSLKKIKYGSVNFNDLKHHVYNRTKSLLPEIF